MIDYKIKYKNLKAQMLQNIDVSYRLGYEQGYKDATQEAQAQQMAQAQADAQAAQAAAAGMQPGQDPNAQPGQPGQQDPNAMGGDPSMVDPNAAMGGDPNAAMGSPDAMAGMGDEMGQEGMDPNMGGDELDNSLAELESMVAKGEKPNVLDLRNKVNALASLRKSQKDKVKSNRQQVVSAQKSIVDSVIKSWGKKTEETTEDIEKLIREKGIEI
jgi:hypothetical protein